MISAGVEGRIPYMTYPEPWRGPPKQPPEFLRPAPKPLPSTNRYNGISNSVPNGTRLAPPQRPISKYPSPPAASPVNLTQHKEDLQPEDLQQYSATYSRLFTHTPHFNPYHAGPYASLYQSPYTQLIRPNFVQPAPLTPLDTYSPTTPTATSVTFLSPQATFSPPAAVRPGQSVLRDRKPLPPPPPSSFKVPSGKEGSLKHRILTRPEEAARAPLDLQRESRKRLTSTAISPPQSPAKPLNNNTLVPAKFAKGSLIQLASGELRRVEDMRTEDFVLSAERSPELRLADSTVVRIEENPITGTATITLSYNQRRTQVEIESSLEHPFFVYGQGWASCKVDRTLQCYGLKVHRLQVGDILISLTPKESVSSTASKGSTIMTTATTTAMTVRQVSTTPREHRHLMNNLLSDNNERQNQPQNHHQHIQQRPLSPESLARKRRWSAPDQICEEEELVKKLQRIE